MRRSKTFWGLVAIAVVGLGLLAHLLLGAPAPIVAGDPTGADVLVDMEGTELHEEQDGNTIWSVRAERIQYNPRTRDFYLTNLTATFRQGDEVLVVRAPKAQLSEKTQRMVLGGTVTAEGVNRHFEGTQLLYTGTNGTLESEQPFVYRDGTITLRADRLTANRVLSRITAKGHVQLTKE